MLIPSSSLLEKSNSNGQATGYSLLVTLKVWQMIGLQQPRLSASLRRRTVKFPGVQKDACTYGVLNRL